MLSTWIKVITLIISHRILINPNKQTSVRVPRGGLPLAAPRMVQRSYKNVRTTPPNHPPIIYPIFIDQKNESQRGDRGWSTIKMVGTQARTAGARGWSQAAPEGAKATLKEAQSEHNGSERPHSSDSL